MHSQPFILLHKVVNGDAEICEVKSPLDFIEVCLKITGREAES